MNVILASDGAEHQLKEAAHKLAKEFKLTDEEINEFLPLVRAIRELIAKHRG